MIIILICDFQFLTLVEVSFGHLSLTRAFHYFNQTVRSIRADNKYSL